MRRLRPGGRQVMGLVRWGRQGTDDGWSPRKELCFQGVWPPLTVVYIRLSVSPMQMSFLWPGELVMQVSASVPLGSVVVGWRPLKVLKSLVRIVRVLPKNKQSDGPLHVTDFIFRPRTPLTGSGHP